MTSQNKKCPSQKQLSDFNLGKLPEKSIEAISRHVITGNANGTAYIIRLKPPESIQAETSTN